MKFAAKSCVGHWLMRVLSPAILAFALAGCVGSKQSNDDDVSGVPRPKQGDKLPFKTWYRRMAVMFALYLVRFSTIRPATDGIFTCVMLANSGVSPGMFMLWRLEMMSRSPGHLPPIFPSD